jgi:hypothetical protein
MAVATKSEANLVRYSLLNRFLTRLHIASILVTFNMLASSREQSY